MELTVMTKTNGCIDLKGVKSINRFEEGYYFENEEGATILFVPTDNLAYYQRA